MSVATVFTPNSSHAHAATILLGFVFCPNASAACLTSQLQHIVCPLSGRSVCVFPLSNVSDISSDPGQAALSWYSMGQVFMISDINFL